MALMFLKRRKRNKKRKVHQKIVLVISVFVFSFNLWCFLCNLVIRPLACFCFQWQLLCDKCFFNIGISPARMITNFSMFMFPVEKKRKAEEAQRSGATANGSVPQANGGHAVCFFWNFFLTKLWYLLFMWMCTREDKTWVTNCLVMKNLLVCRIFLEELLLSC